MQIRVSRVRSGSNIYEYAQLVESYRRKSDGLPVHRVLANLGKLEPQKVNNLKIALEASRKGKQVVIPQLPDLAESKLSALKPQENLRYLDVAVLLELWRDWGLGELLDELMPTANCTVAPSAVVAALTIQRGVDPRSKLHAQRWYPRTALPELLGVPPRQFNNTRLHRVLEDLDQVTPALMKRLPRTYTDREGAFASLFLDVTDTWFVGEGPQLSERSKTKEGFVREKVGIVLLCSTQGYPLRWKVIPGRQSDNVAMANMFRSIQGLHWLGEAPVVCDRAMGNTSQIRQLLSCGVRFLTALTLVEFGAYTDRIPHHPFADLEPVPPGDKNAKKLQIVEAARFAEAAGMKKVFDDLFVFDLGVVERPGDEEFDGEAVEVDSKIEGLRLGRAIKEAVDTGQSDTYRAAGRKLGIKESLTSTYVQLCRLPEELQEQVLDGALVGLTLSDLVRVSRMESPERQHSEIQRLARQVDNTVETMRLGRSIQQAVASGESGSCSAAGKALGLKPSVSAKYLKLCLLAEDIQQLVLAGQAVGVCLKELLRVSAIEQPKRQREEFDRLVQEALSRNRARPSRALRATNTKPPGSEPIHVRAVAFFNPELFVNQRCHAKQRLGEIQRFVDKLNSRLASPHARRTPTKITAEVETKLRSYNLVDAYNLEVEKKEIDNRPRYQVKLTLDSEVWARRRRYDGFCLLVAHPDVSHTPEELCRLYRAKDAVEKDFEVIKSVVKLRPVRHHTDAKVRAHVTLCMLALLLERTLRQRLGGKWTSDAALELLADRCLNRYSHENGSSVYAVTRTTEEQEAILRVLQLQHLTDDNNVADRILPR